MHGRHQLHLCLPAKRAIYWTSAKEISAIRVPKPVISVGKR
jgi:hypothetical protein